mmetsp:Transcript_4036/g.14264  ORF Transcript_4036/g.14264 Transcript_4036/m.14264 type:complete len:327 (-) Transcript_4036:80-1060(-)
MREAVQALKPHRHGQSAFAAKSLHDSENVPNVRKSTFAAGSKKAMKAAGKRKAGNAGGKKKTRRVREEVLEEEDSNMDISMDLVNDADASFVAEENTTKKQRKASSGMDAEDVMAHELYQNLQEKYEYIKALRETRMEQLYNKLQADIAAKETAATKLIASLRQQLQEKEKEAAAAERRAKEQEAKVRMLELLTSLQLTAEPGTDATRPEGPFIAKLFGKVKDDCGQTVMIPLAKLRENIKNGQRNAGVVTNSEPAIVFRAFVNDEEEVEYSPVKIRSDVQEQLEHYLMEDIAFDTTEAPQFLSKLLEGVLNDGEAYDEDDLMEDE